MITIGGGDIPVEVPFAAAFDHLDSVFTLHLEAWQRKWGFLGDLSHFDLGDLVSGPLGLVSADVDLENWILEVAAGRRFADESFLILGVHEYRVGVDLTPTGESVLVPSAEEDQYWLDPFVGFGWRPQLSHRWSLALRGDIGGFGLATDLVWQAFASIDVRLSHHLAAGAGYRVLDYDNQQPRDEFAFEIEHSGPLAFLSYYW